MSEPTIRPASAADAAAIGGFYALEAEARERFGGYLMKNDAGAELLR